MLAWTKKVKRRGLSEQPIDIRVVTKACNIKFINGITWINVNHSSSTALERSVIDNGGGGGWGVGWDKSILQVPLTSPSASADVL